MPIGRVIFEIGGTPIREELAREGAFIPSVLIRPSHPVIALRQAASKLPTIMEFIRRSTPPRLGNLVLHPTKPVHPKTDADIATLSTTSDVAVQNSISV